MHRICFTSHFCSLLLTFFYKETSRTGFTQYLKTAKFDVDSSSTKETKR